MKFGTNNIAYDAINGITQIRKSPTIFFVISCRGKNHIMTHIGPMNIEENQKVTTAKSFMSID